MGDFIERQAVLNAYDAVQRKNGPWRFETLIESVPAANVRPVVLGRWVKIYEDGEPAVEQHQVGVCCSKCMRMPEDKFTESDFCPHCGADMREAK